MKAEILKARHDLWPELERTAHLLALFGVFLDVGVRLGVPAAPLAFQLLFATNYFSAIAPQGSSANLLFAEALSAEQRAKKVKHQERGVIDVEDILTTIAGHGVHHLKQFKTY